MRVRPKRESERGLASRQANPSMPFFGILLSLCSSCLAVRHLLSIAVLYPPWIGVKWDFFRTLRPLSRRKSFSIDSLMMRSWAAIDFWGCWEDETSEPQPYLHLCFAGGPIAGRLPERP